MEQPPLPRPLSLRPLSGGARGDTTPAHVHILGGAGRERACAARGARTSRNGCKTRKGGGWLLFSATSGSHSSFFSRAARPWRDAAPHSLTLSPSRRPTAAGSVRPEGRSPPPPPPPCTPAPRRRLAWRAGRALFFSLLIFHAPLNGRAPAHPGHGCPPVGPRPLPARIPA